MHDHPTRHQTEAVKNVLISLPHHADASDPAQLLRELSTCQEINQKILAEVPFGLLAYNTMGQCILVNEAAASILGGTREQLLQQNFHHIPAWHDYGLLDMANQVLARQKADHRQLYYTSTFGKGLWLDFRATPITIDSSDSLLLIISDISEQKLAEWQLTLQQSHMEEQVQARTIDLHTANLQLRQEIAERKRIEDQLQYQATLLQTISDAIIGTDLHFVITAWNRAAETLYGWSAQEAIGKRVSDLLHAEYAHDSYEEVVQSVIESESWRGEVIHTTKAGQRIPVLAAVALVKDSHGTAIGSVSVIRDMTANKETEDKLLTLSSAVEQSPVSILITDATGEIEYVNPKFTQLTGYQLDEVKGKNPRILKAGTTTNLEYRKLWQTITSGGQWQGELHNRAKDGSLFWESALISPIVNHSGKITHFVAIKEDIRERKQREIEQSALLTLAMALRAAIDKAEMLPAILQQSALLVSAPIAAFVAYQPATKVLTIEAIYRQGDTLFETDIPLPSDEGISAAVLQTGEAYWIENVLDDPRLVYPHLICDERAIGCIPIIVQGEPLGLLWVMRERAFSADEARLMTAVADMAAVALHRATLHEKVLCYANDLEEEVAIRTQELAQANERLQELDRLKSKFVSDVTHELRTPVTNISLYLRLLERKPDKQAEYISILLGQADRLRTLVKDTLDLSRLDQMSDHLNLVQVDLNALTQSVVIANMARAETQGLSLCFTPAPHAPLIMGDYDKLHQVITNLIVNALNYTPAGQVHVSTRIDSTSVNNGRQTICCEVSDTGCGIHADDLPHLFDRFYRGKRDKMPPVPGTGLGLSIVKEIVTRHGGDVCVSSEVGVGSTFILCLPLSQQPPSHQAQLK